MRRDGGSVFPVHANTGDPNGLSMPARYCDHTDIHDGPEQTRSNPTPDTLMQDRNRSTNDSRFYLPKINPSATSQKDYLLYLPGQRGIACRLTRTPPLIREPLNASRPEPSVVMSAERSNNSTPTLPRCASCAQLMLLIRRTQRFGGLPDLYMFECRACGVSNTEECARCRDGALLPHE